VQLHTESKADIVLQKRLHVAAHFNSRDTYMVYGTTSQCCIWIGWWNTCISVDSL